MSPWGADDTHCWILEEVESAMAQYGHVLLALQGSLTGGLYCSAHMNMVSFLLGNTSKYLDKPYSAPLMQHNPLSRLFTCLYVCIYVCTCVRLYVCHFLVSETHINSNIQHSVHVCGTQH